MPEKVALIGSGNWGSAIATKLGQNALSNDMFDSTVEMWVFEEYVKKEGDDWVRPARGAKPPEGKTWEDEGYRTLTGVINEIHENPIYLKGIPLPTSIHAEPDVAKAVAGATMMVFVIPHNFLAPIVPKMSGAFAPGAIGISLIKGIEFEDAKPVLISDLLAKEMAKAEGAPKVSKGSSSSSSSSSSGGTRFTLADVAGTRRMAERQGVVKAARSRGEAAGASSMSVVEKERREAAKPCDRGNGREWEAEGVESAAADTDVLRRRRWWHPCAPEKHAVGHQLTPLTRGSSSRLPLSFPCVLFARSGGHVGAHGRQRRQRGRQG